ncbi:hypothetical protein Tco_1297355 [Tanacetum coccineum]
MVPPNNLGPDVAGKPVNATSYRGIIGKLMYLTATRPNIQFFTVLCARYQFNPKESHLTVVKRILRYLKGKAPQSVAMSSVEAEYVAAAGCCASILWMKSQLSDYDIHYKMVPIFCDNTSAIAISNNPVLHSRTKHIDIRYHFIRDHILKEDIELHFIPTEYQLADIFTKPLDEPTFTRLKAEILFTFVIQVLSENYSSTEQINSIPQMIAYCLIIGTEVDIGDIIYSDLITKLLSKSRLKYVSYHRFISCALEVLLGSEYTQDKQFGSLPNILSNSNFLEDPSKVIDIELTGHMIAVNNQKDSVSPLPVSRKKNKVKSQTVTPTLPKSQGRDASGAFSVEN